jgi:glycosyltransferase involved in cell wall biosynthesis
MTAHDAQDATFNYLLLNHNPLGSTDDPATREIGTLWLQDVQAQAAALAEVGGRLILATPLMQRLEVDASGSFEFARIDLRKIGFEYVGLPYYRNLREYWTRRARCIHAIQPALARSAVVQCGAGGYPFSPGYAVWPAIARHKAVNIWVMDGGDAAAQRQLQVAQERNFLKRWRRRWIVDRLSRFETERITSADLVFAHNRSTPKTYAHCWGPNCHTFDRSFVTDSMLLSTDGLQQRAQRLADTSRPLRLVIASRLVAIKAVDEALQAVAAAQQQGARVALDIYGDGADRAALEALAGDLGATDTAFHGSVPYGEPFFERMRQGDVLLITNVVPEFSRNILLGMAMGLPIIAYRNQGHDDVLGESGAAAVAPMRDVAALAAVIRKLADQRHELVEMMERGRRYVADKTLEGCHRQRARLVAEVLGKQTTTQPAASQPSRPAPAPQVS